MIISVEEQFRGWLAQIHWQHDPHERIATYQRLQWRIAFFAAWHVLPWDADAAHTLQELRRQRIRIGTMDLKIASIVLAHDATLLSRNLRDFHQVPNLRVEDWLS
jgi:tRNA(fMet)-specific endonuclease VapC